MAMIIRKSFQYSLRPTKKQARELDVQLEECRWLYNELLNQRILAFEDLNISLTKYQQAMLIPFLKEERESLNHVHSQVLQNVVDRLEKAFKSFFRRCKTGENPGFPRFRGKHRYNSFCFPQTGFCIEENHLKLSKIGKIRIKMHRPIEGIVKTCTIRKNASGDWLVSFSCEVSVETKPAIEGSVGIDMGLENFATLSDGKIIENPRFFKREEKILAKEQKKLSKLEKGTKKRRQQGKVVSKIHERISNKRKDFCHKQSKQIVDNYQNICVEDLDVKQMIEGSHLSKSITDASWNLFLQYLTYKAEEAGRKLGLVNPAYTTQDCNRCGQREKKKLSERKHRCKNCGYETSRDFNAAQNILALGLDGQREISRSLRL